MAVGELGVVKSAPDLSKLQAMQQPVVVVTKGRKGAGRAIITGIQMPANDILALMQHSLVANYGAGIYKFEVTDAGGDGGAGSKDMWTAQLGPDTQMDFGTGNNGGATMTPESTEDFSMAVASPSNSGFNGQSNGATMPPSGNSGNGNGSGGIGLPQAFLNRPQPAAASSAPPVGVPEGSIQVAPGWWYNQELSILSNRNGELHTWRPGMPLPGSTTTVPPVALPALGAAYPVRNDDDDRIRALEKQLAEAKEAAREEARERDRRAEIEALRVSMERQAETTRQMIEAQNANFAKMLESLSKPQTSDTERLLREELARANAQREADRQAAEFQRALLALEAKLAEATTKQPDQTLPAFMQILGQNQQAASAMIQAIQTASHSGVEASRENMRLMMERMGSSQMTPERIVDLIRTMKTDRGTEGEANKTMMNMFKDIFSMGQEMLRNQAEALGAGTQQTPAWVGIAQQLADKAGSVAQAIAVSKAQDAARAERNERHERERREQARLERISNAHTNVQRVVAPVAAAPQLQPRAAARAAAAPAPVAATPAGPRRPTAAEIRDAAAAQMFTPVAPSSSQGQRDALAASIGLVPASSAAADAPTPKAKRGRKPKAQAPAEEPFLAPVYPMPASTAAPVQTFEDELEAAEDEDGDELEHDAEGELVSDADSDADVSTSPVRTAPLAEVSPEEVLHYVNSLDDVAFFGTLVQSHIQSLRQQIAEGVLSDPEEITNFIGQAVQMLHSVPGMAVPPAVELLYNGHAPIAIQRLLHGAPGALVSKVTALVIDSIDHADDAG